MAAWLWWRAKNSTSSTDQTAGVKSVEPVVSLPQAPPVAPSLITNLSKLADTSTPLELVRQTNPAASTLPRTNPPGVEAAFAPRPVRDIFEAQLAIERQGISSGSLDGVLGSQTRAALRVLQTKEKLPVTGQLDDLTRLRLMLQTPATTNYTILSNDLARLRPVPRTWLGKSKVPRLDYETILELVAEKGHAHPDLISQLNPSVNWSQATNGLSVRLPAVDYPPPNGRATFIRIQLSEKTLEAFDAHTNLLAHFPCSIGRNVEKRPIGELRIIQIVRHPNYVFKPEIFPESEEGRTLGRRLILPPGPNNPVGIAWIGLNKEGYGIHGTPRPEEVGRTESHGCFRLSNWNAEYLIQLVGVGTSVRVER